MSKKSEAGRKVAHDFFISRGYVPDRYGNLKKGDIRIKFNPNKLRYEKRLNTKPVRWIRIVSGYYKDISIKDDKIYGLKRR